MIDIAELVKDKPVRGNFFSPEVYVQGDIELGLLENRSGARLLALPEVLVQALYAGLEEEVGPSTGVVLFSCGRWWGKGFYRRFVEDVSKYYDKSMKQMEMVEFLECFKQCWKTHGWGVCDFDMKYYQQGFLVITVENSPFAEAAPQNKQPMCFLEAGILSAFFSQLTKQNLHAVQTTCESLGADSNRFILGLEDRLKVVDAWKEEGHDHATIMELLCRNQMASLEE